MKNFMSRKGDLTLNMPLRNGDVIRVPISGKVFVGGEVKNPVGIDLAGRRLTVSQAVLLTGGFTPKADGSETRVIRYLGKTNEKEIVSIDVYAVDKGQREDVYLKENDIVLVPKSGTKSFFIELWDFVKGRVGSVGLGTVY